MRDNFKLCLVGSEFSQDDGQGIFRVCQELYSNMKKRCKVEKIALGSSKNQFKTIFNNILKSLFKVFRKKADIYHFLMPEIATPCFFKKPSVVTVYDVIPLILKNERKKSFNLYFRLMMFFTKRADHFIVISEATRQDLIKICGIPEEKITLIYIGVDHKKFFPIEHKEKNKKITIGFLGGLVKRKNATILLDVAKLLENENVHFKIGGKGAGLEELKLKKERLGLKNVEFVGFIPEEELNEFYNSLDLFIAPTTYDGFCMPALESMASGCAVIVSKTGALPEVGGDAALLIDPYSAKDIARKVKKFLNSDKLQSTMKEKSVKHAAKFQWDKQAKETFQVYKKVLEGKK